MLRKIVVPPAAVLVVVACTTGKPPDSSRPPAPVANLKVAESTMAPGTNTSARKG
jgi:hypothetical protein